jgi:hypothetical protein
MTVKMSKADANKVIELLGEARRALNAAEDLMPADEEDSLFTSDGDNPYANIVAAIECIEDAQDGMKNKDFVKVGQ